MDQPSERRLVLTAISASITYSKERGGVFSRAEEARRLVMTYPDAGFTFEALLAEIERLLLAAGLPAT